MTQAKQTPRDRKTAQLEAQVLELHRKLAEALEDGLRLSQENEALQKELAALKKSR